MKKITVYISDETAEIIDKIAQRYEYYKYPLEQAYGFIIDEALALR